MRTSLGVLLVMCSLAAAGLGAAERGVLLTEVPVLDAAGDEITLYRESHALLIGVSDYTGGWPDLPGVREDLRVVKGALERQGFQVEVLEDPSQAELEAAFRDFILRHGRKRDNRLLFYFAGHGHTVKPAWAADDPDEWMGYIVSRDAPLPDQDFAGFRRNALSMQRFEELAKDIQSKHALFVFDSCFSGSVFALSRSRPPDISRRTARPVRQFITSGSADQEVPDLSIFRRQLVAALEGEADRGGDGYVTGSELGYFLTETVTNYSEGAQTPQSGKIRHRRLDKGDFVFVVRADEPAAPPQVARGHLQVSVNVPAQVHIGGELSGEASPGRPLNLRNLPVGPLEVRARARGYLAETQSARIQRDRWTQLPVRLVPEPPPAVPALPLEPAADAPQAVPPVPILTPAQSRRVQAALNALGWNAGPADGVFGPRTRQALRDYQRSLGETASGYLTAQQWARLAGDAGESVPEPLEADIDPELVREAIMSSAESVADLLAMCDALLSANQLTTGTRGNAFDCYKKVLKQDPGNAKALAGLERITETYLRWVKSNSDRGLWKRAETYLERAKRNNPKHPQIVVLEKELKARKRKEFRAGKKDDSRQRTSKQTQQESRSLTEWADSLYEEQGYRINKR